MSQFKQWLMALASVALLAMAAAIPAQAEDIDIYTGFNPSGSDAPTVLLIWDTASKDNANVNSVCTYTDGSGSPSLSANKVAGMEQCAMVNALLQIKNSTQLSGKLKIGLMVFNQSGFANNGNSNCGWLAFPPTLMDTAGIGSLISKIKGFTGGGQGILGNATSVGDTMAEAWAMLNGKSTSCSTVNYSAYISSVAQCRDSVIIYIGNAFTNSQPKDGNANPGASPLLTTELKTAFNYQTSSNPYKVFSTPIAVSGLNGSASGSDYWADEWARFMKRVDVSISPQSDHNITTYTISVADFANIAQAQNVINYYAEMAQQGGGKTFLISGNDNSGLVAALLQIFNEIQSVDSVFASATLPVAANAQGTYLNQVFIGMFRPDGNAVPRWYGNLKQYQLGLDAGGKLVLTDSKQDPDAGPVTSVTNPNSGNMAPTAVSFWTTNTPGVTGWPDASNNLGFWSNAPSGDSLQFDSADGAVVEKGAAAEMLRAGNLLQDYSQAPSTTVNTRRLYTCTGSCGSGTSLSATPFAQSNSNLTLAALGLTGQSMSISSISRDDTTKKATVTLSSAPPTPIQNGQSITISGSTNAVYNGTFTITLLNSTHFTFPIADTALTPGASVATPANWSVSTPSSSTTLSITSLVRSGTTATATATSVAGLANGQAITISGATPTIYNNSWTISNLNTTNKTFDFTVALTPSLTISGPSGKSASATPSGPSAAASFTFKGSDVATEPFGTSIKVMITGGNNATSGWVANGSNTVTVAGLAPPEYNGTWTITGVGSACNVNSVVGTANKSVCFTIPATPASPATGTMTATAGNGGSTFSVSSIVRGATNCAVSSSATATVTTTTSHGLSTGALVNISGGSGTEAAYVKTGQSITVPAGSLNTFTYPVTVAPACSETTPGMQASSTSSINRDALIRWIRGEDNVGDEPSPDDTHTTINIRPSVHGDVMHSRPAAVNYGTTGVVVFYGSNDGVFHAVNGNKTAAIGSVRAGGELWGFIPTEFASKLSRLYLNSPLVNIAGVQDTSATAKDYFFDGSTTVFQDTRISGSTAGKTYLFLSTRRGGAYLYALDVTTPTDPKFLWKFTSSDLAELGQTWSQPKVARIRGYDKPVVIMGAGYDGAVSSSDKREDADLAPTSDQRGRGVVILDATTGQLVWAELNSCSGVSTGTCVTNTDMTRSVAADITLLDRNNDGYIDRLYAADVGANIWRIDLEPNGYSSVANNNPPAASSSVKGWTTTWLAKLGCTATVCPDNNARKFLFAPDVISTNRFDAVLAVSGDREHPLYTTSTTAGLAYNVQNRFYMIEDRYTGFLSVRTTPLTDADLINNTSTICPTGSTFDTTQQSCIANGVAVNSVRFDGTDTTINGYYINLGTGEKGVNAPLAVAGKVYFGTNQPIVPSTTSCVTNLGTARAYAVQFDTGARTVQPVTGGGLLPPPIQGAVFIQGKPFGFIIGGSGPTPFDPIKPDPNPSSKYTRMFWYTE